jgi:DNA polymerase II large subunit
MISEARSRLTNSNIPNYYSAYYDNIINIIESNFNLASEARRQNIDVSDVVESKIAYDLADRVAKMHELDIADRLRLLLSHMGKEKAALKIAEEIALGDYGRQDIQIRLDNAVRVSLAIVTEGVTVAPLQGISEVLIKNNIDDSKYLSISFAGPIRSAGGTEAALTMIIADHIRNIVGLDRYKANSYDDETGRFVEELRIYEREVGNFQFRITDNDIIKCISSLPVELDGVDTDPVEVVGHRNMHRISTNRVRGGALRVMNDGLIGRNRKLSKIIQTLELQGWTWLDELNGAIQSDDEGAASHHRMREVITGRPVLSMTNRYGGFRLRYGRSCNTGFATVGIHSVIPILLKNAVVVGTQIKIDIPGKASTVALVDSIEPPIVKLTDNSVVRITNVEQAISVSNSIKKILYLGDILISYGDFLENNSKLLPASYVEEIWASELKNKLSNKENSFYNTTSINHDRLTQLINNPLYECPTPFEAFDISTRFNIPLHPRYTLYWDVITLHEVTSFLNILSTSNVDNYTKLGILPNTIDIKDILEKLGVIHTIDDNNKNLILTDPNQVFVIKTIAIKLNQNKELLSYLKQFEREKNTLQSIPDDNMELISYILGVTVKRKYMSSIAVRVGRPEKAAERKMKPPVHCLFPVGTKGGPTRDIMKAANQGPLYIEIANRICSKCQSPSIGICCYKCKTFTQIQKLCTVCKRSSENNHNDNDNDKCNFCNNYFTTHSVTNFPLKYLITKTTKDLNVFPVEPLKGVKSLMNKNRCAEPLEKGILRQKNNIFTFKDGTIRFDATNEPLTHFKPKWILNDVSKLRKLGYTKDYLGTDLTSSHQLVELMMQDIIIPIQAAEHLLHVSKFIDDELEKLYDLSAFYNATSINDLTGHLIVGLAPHTSVGIVGRIIGFTNSQVCLASPVWHSAKRRDCDGDADSLMLLLDIFLNFSREYLPDKIGGLMDAPLLVQPFVLPHEVQRQAHNIDISDNYPIEFYHNSWNNRQATDSIEYIDLIKKRIEQTNEFFDYNFTHPTGTITLSDSRSSYSSLNTMEDKLNMQMNTANIIQAVDPDDVASMVLTTHILPDIMGNMRAYSSQSFRCNKCGTKYRRIPVIGKCIECDNSLLQTVTRGSVEKYIGIALDLCHKYKVDEYLVNRIKSLELELTLLFKNKEKTQFSIMDFA